MEPWGGPRGLIVKSCAQHATRAGYSVLLGAQVTQLEQHLSFPSPPSRVEKLASKHAQDSALAEQEAASILLAHRSCLMMTTADSSERLHES